MSTGSTREGVNESMVEDSKTWWYGKDFEDQFYKVIELLGTDKHPHNLNEMEIIKLYKHFG